MSYTVLIVDDSPIIRKMVRKSIEMAGVPVGEAYEAGNGREALEVMRAHWIDIVFADLNMPEMNGMQMMEEMSKDSVLTSTPVVVVSSDQDPEKIASITSKGMRAYLKKPFRPEGIKAVVAQLLEGGPGSRGAGGGDGR
jgi:two-component system chemotaxis response regulator CheY